MFGMGGGEILVIFLLALLLFGPRKLPEIGRALGKTMAEFRKATQEFRVSLEREVELDKLREAKKDVADATSLTEPRAPRPPGPPAVPPPVVLQAESTEAKPPDDSTNDGA